ncbi:hypothetical protein PGB90_003523 [Kerria lacca]
MSDIDIRTSVFSCLGQVEGRPLGLSWYAVENASEKCNQRRIGDGITFDIFVIERTIVQVDLELYCGISSERTNKTKELNVRKRTYRRILII